MKIKSYFFRSQQGGMMVELLLALALAAIMIPFIMRTQQSRITRAQNIVIAKQMESVSKALEKYIDVNKKSLLAPVGKNITRVKMAALEEYGLSDEIISKRGDEFQLRILKSSDRGGQATLQGIVLMSSADITPLRTREIANIGGDKSGFVEGGKAFGAFGSWHANAFEFGLSGKNGIVKTTAARRKNDDYIWRFPSINAADATMLSSLNLGGHDLIDGKFLDANLARFEEIAKSATLVAEKMIFQNRTTIDKNFETVDAVVSGNMSSDGRGMEVTGTLTLSDTAKFSNITADDLYVMNLNLSGLSVSSAGGAAILRINQAMDMTAGHINASFVTVGFTGSITPQLTISKRIEDSSDPRFYWDLTSGRANLSDASLAELSRMAPMIAKKESGSTTVSGQLFNTISANKNATASDFMNAIDEIQNRVKAKFHMLNLE